MRPLRSSTVGIVAELAVDRYSRDNLKLLFMQVGLGRYLPHDPFSKAGLVTDTVLSAERDAEGDDEVVQGLHEFVRLVAARVAVYAEAPGPEYGGLETDPAWKRLGEALRADGYDPRYEDRAVRLLPMDEPHAPLSAEVTELEAEFQQLGMTAALTHYKQATDHLTREHYESANGALRSMVEAVVCQIAEQQGRPWERQGQGQAALQYLIDETKVLPRGQGGNFVRGLWEIIQTNGPHPRTTTAGEARFRFQAGTACVRWTSVASKRS
ncbi:hypothetical protein OKJ48_09900 [Streptomyces kunmingensis]|uniref:Uncharacterized protein n=1 Tax=Streptomyces kunmingensis TaxID=68225 RepID=A0ABU6C894_9ACTN|nr:hypothetical protein [Streptomyces kunmingensis]MEB3960555.1 hypothetical protein [Streptomyces kunmingensis]